MSVYRFVASFVALVCLTFMCGCQSGGSAAPAAASMDASKAVLVTAGNGGSVLYLSAGDGTVHSLTTDGAPMCNQCETDATDYFKTGHIDPVCAVCGAHRTTLISPTTLGHQ
jgi:hypothetical protein